MWKASFGAVLLPPLAREISSRFTKTYQDCVAVEPYKDTGRTWKLASGRSAKKELLSQRLL